VSKETAMLVNDFAPVEVILLPLYPQFSTTTTESSVRMWREACRIARLDVPTRLLSCYPTESRSIASSRPGAGAASPRHCLRDPRGRRWQTDLPGGVFGVPQRDDYRCRSNYMARGRSSGKSRPSGYFN
jgi:hypothetical protein